MSEMVDRVALALLLLRYPDGTEYWPDRLDELVNGPPFEADGYRDMARAAIEVMRVPTEAMLKADEVHPSCHMCGGHLEGWKLMIDAALK